MGYKKFRRILTVPWAKIIGGYKVRIRRAIRIFESAKIKWGNKSFFIIAMNLG